MANPPGPDVPIGITVLITSVMGTSVGPFALLVFAAVTGGLLGLSKAGVTTRAEGARHLALSVALSLVLTSAGVWAVEHYTPLPANLALMPVSFFIAASRDFLLSFIQGVLSSFANAVGSFTRR